MKTEFKNCKVVMLPTKDKIGSIHKTNNKYYPPSQLISGVLVEHLHLYICSDDEIKEGDYCLIDNRNNRFEKENYSIELCHKKENYWIYTDNQNGVGHNPDWTKKIIATTDQSLNLPEIPEQFLKEFCEKNGIWEVDVEYEKVKNEVFISVGEAPFFQPKLTNNTINIKCSKQTWTKKEVIALCESSYNVGWHIGYDTHSGDSYDSREVFNDWVNQNIL